MLLGRSGSLIGHGYPTIGSGNSDGVVPVASARHPGVQTETLVRAWRTEIHSHPETIQALLHILSQHYNEYQASTGQ